MSEYEPFDEQLAETLQSRAGSGATSVAAAHEAVLARAGHIRRRRAATVGAVAMVALMIGGVVLLPRGGGDTLAPSDTGDVLPSVQSTDEPTPATTVVGDVDATATTIVDLTIPPPTAGSSSTTSVPVRSTTTDGTATTVAGGSPTTNTTPGSTVVPVTNPGTTPNTTTPGTSPPGTSPTSVAPSSSSVPGSSTTAPAATVQPFTRTYDSSGGSITVNWNGSLFSLLNVEPASGYQSEIEDNSATRIRVRFRSDSGDARIEVRVNNGELIVVIS